jgi:hypothetical protein
MMSTKFGFSLAATVPATAQTSTKTRKINFIVCLSAFVPEKHSVCAALRLQACDASID